MALANIEKHVQAECKYLNEAKEFTSINHFIGYLKTIYLSLKLHEFYNCDKCYSTCAITKGLKCRNLLCEDGHCTSKFYYVSLFEILQNLFRRKQFVQLIVEERMAFERRLRNCQLLQELRLLNNSVTILITTNVDWLEFQENYSQGG